MSSGKIRKTFFELKCPETEAGLIVESLFPADSLTLEREKVIRKEKEGICSVRLDGERKEI